MLQLRGVISSVVPAGSGETQRARQMEDIMRAGFILMAILASGTCSAEWSGNIGWASDYFYRGIFQASSSASGGIDYANNGFYAGSWMADVGDGLEVDGYFGLEGEKGGFRYGIGFTGYYYTGEFDDTYEEINLGAGYGIASLDLAIGRYDNFDGPRRNYSYYALTLEKQGFYGKYAGFARDFAGEYLEIGYLLSLAEVDLGLALILANDELVGDSEQSLVFSVGKSFDF